MASASVSAAKTAVPIITVTLKSIIEQLADGHELPKKQANALLVGMIETITTHLKSGDRIRISGIGTLEVRKREARTGRKSGHRRDYADRREQEGGLPPGQGAEGSRLSSENSALRTWQPLARPGAIPTSRQGTGFHAPGRPPLLNRGRSALTWHLPDPPSLNDCASSCTISRPSQRLCALSLN
jgi:nucleoid DNA-binding protein